MAAPLAGQGLLFFENGGGGWGGSSNREMRQGLDWQWFSSHDMSMSVMVDDRHIEKFQQQLHLLILFCMFKIRLTVKFSMTVARIKSWAPPDFSQPACNPGSCTTLQLPTMFMNCSRVVWQAGNLCYHLARLQRVTLPQKFFFPVTAKQAVYVYAVFFFLSKYSLVRIHSCYQKTFQGLYLNNQVRRITYTGRFCLQVHHYLY